jgi:hypothetical protein
MYIPFELLPMIIFIIGAGGYMLWYFGVEHGKTERDIAHFVKTGDWPNY